MTLAVEKRPDGLWLVSRDKDDKPKLLAKFRGAEAAQQYVRETAASMAFAREVGRAGLG